MTSPVVLGHRIDILLRSQNGYGTFVYGHRRMTDVKNGSDRDLSKS